MTAAMLHLFSKFLEIRVGLTHQIGLYQILDLGRGMLQKRAAVKHTRIVDDNGHISDFFFDLVMKLFDLMPTENEGQFFFY